MTENKRFTVYGKEIVQGDECWAVAYSEYNADVIATALNELAEENKDLEEARSYYQENFLTMKTERNQLKKENKQLQERNNRQCKQLDDLYRLIEEKDWRALTDIMDDFKKSDELLQKEWRYYE